jgi:hypothetical protein
MLFQSQGFKKLMDPMRAYFFDMKTWTFARGLDNPDGFWLLALKPWWPVMPNAQVGPVART